MLLRIFALGLAVLFLMTGCTHNSPGVPPSGEADLADDPRVYEGEPIHLIFPFENGEYYITQGGSTRDSNYHYWHNFFRNQGMHVSVRYAVDIHKVGEGGLNQKVTNPGSLEDYAMYGEPLYSPTGGVIHYLQDGHPDMPVGVYDMENPRGNHVVLRADDIYLAMLHLMPGSIQVSIGDEVEEGQYLGLIGNSGSTSVPHLHIQAARGNTWFGEAVPMLFDGQFLVRGDRVVRE